MSQTLRSSRLEIRVREPGEVYRGSRFDWSTNVDSILLDGKHQFASSESLDPADLHTRGSGLHAEFGIRTALGYDQAKPGERFYKIGVGGILREGAEPYDFYHLYKDVQPAPVSFRLRDHVDGQEIEFKSATALGKNFGWKLVRTYRVAGRALTIKNELTNTGLQTIDTSEYCHNFIKLGDKSICPDYELSVNFPLAASFEGQKDKTGILEVREGKVPRFLKEPGIGSEHQFWVGSLSAVADSAKTADRAFGLLKDASWALRDRETGISVSERLEGTCLRVDMWGMRHVCSLELFAVVKAEPGETIRWARHYMFATATDFAGHSQY